MFFFLNLDLCCVAREEALFCFPLIVALCSRPISRQALHKRLTCCQSAPVSPLCGLCGAQRSRQMEGRTGVREVGAA